jgi:hypothetical protein
MSGEEIARNLYAELSAIIEWGPGQSAEALRKARGALDSWTRHSDPYVREKALEALGDFEVWFSSRRWNKSRDGGQHARVNLTGSISKLRNAIESAAKPSS